MEEIRNDYKAVFNTPAGKQVLDDLRKRARSALVDNKEVNAYNAVYRVAQEDLVAFIEKRIQSKV